MRAQIRILLISLTLLVTGLVGCRNMERSINIELPAAPPQLVVECYLEPDSLYRVFLSETIPYFSAPSTIPLITDAIVTISVNNGAPITLSYSPPGNRQNQFAFGEYRSTQRVPRDFNAVFTLSIRDTKGRSISGTTMLVRPIAGIDTVRANYDDRGRKAQVYLSWPNPDQTQTNYYRVIYDQGKPDSNFVFLRSDFLRQGGPRDFTFSDFRYKQKDSVMVRLYRVPRAYWDYVRSVNSAINGNTNPFAQPQSLISNVQGGLGIFAGLAQTRQKIIIPAPPQ